MCAGSAVRTSRSGAKQGSSRGGGVVVGHVVRVVDDHPPGRRDGLGSCLLAVGGHFRSTVMNLN